MRLEQIAKNIWEVLAVLDAEDRCVLNELQNQEPNQQRECDKMLGLILRDVPDNGPRVHNKNFCSPLGDNTFKFKKGPKTGQKLRVAWFYDDGEPAVRRRIICTESYWKGADTPPAVIDRAERLRLEYIQAKQTGQLEIEGVEE